MYFYSFKFYFLCSLAKARFEFYMAIMLRPWKLKYKPENLQKMKKILFSIQDGMG